MSNDMFWACFSSRNDTKFLWNFPKTAKSRKYYIKKKDNSFTADNKHVLPLRKIFLNFNQRIHTKKYNYKFKQYERLIGKNY